MAAWTTDVTSELITKLRLEMNQLMPRHRCEICADVVASGHGNPLLQFVSPDALLTLPLVRGPFKFFQTCAVL